MLTGEIGQRSLAADEAGAGRSEGRLRDGGTEAGAEGGRGSEESGCHGDVWMQRVG